MPQKNDLSALKHDTKAERILPSLSESVTSESSARENEAQIQHQKRVGRPPKKPGEKRSYKVTLSLTNDEGMAIKEKSGLASEATYLYALLKDIGAFSSDDKKGI